MSDPTSAQKIRANAVEQATKIAAAQGGWAADDVVRAADLIARFVKEGEVPLPTGVGRLSGIARNV